jgi:hypothetical protein
MSIAAAFGRATDRARLERRPINLGLELLSYRRRLPERPLPTLLFACFLEAVAIGVLALPDLTVKVVFSSTLLATAVAIVYITLFRSSLEISVHEYGVRIARGKNYVVALFSNVERVYATSGGEEKPRLVLHFGDKRMLSIEGWDHALRTTFDAILESSNKVIGPRVLADFYAGEPVDFGAVRLSRHAILVRHGRLPIKNIASVSVRRGRFMVVQDDGRTFVSMECFKVATSRHSSCSCRAFAAVTRQGGRREASSSSPNRRVPPELDRRFGSGFRASEDVGGPVYRSDRGRGKGRARAARLPLRSRRRAGSREVGEERARLDRDRLVPGRRPRPHRRRGVEGARQARALR